LTAQRKTGLLDEKINAATPERALCNVRVDFMKTYQ